MAQDAFDYTSHYDSLLSSYPGDKRRIIDTIKRLHSTGAPVRPPSIQDLEAMANDFDAQGPWEVTKGLKSGLHSSAGMLKGAVGMAGDAVGLDSVRDWGYEGYQNSMEKAAEYTPRVSDIRDVGSLGDAADWFMGTLGQLGPSVAEIAASALAGGGIAGVAARTAAKKTIKAAVEAEVKKGVAKEVAEEMIKDRIKKTVIPMAIKRGKQAGVVLGSGTLESGGMYGEAADAVGVEEANPYAAAGLGLVSGLTELAAPEGRILTTGLRKTPGKFLSRAARTVPKNMLEEGTQEAVQHGLSEMNMEFQDPNHEIDPGSFATPFAAGMAGGFMFGGLEAIPRDKSAKTGGETDEETSEAAEETETPQGLKVSPGQPADLMAGNGPFRENVPIQGLRIQPQAPKRNDFPSDTGQGAAYESARAIQDGIYGEETNNAKFDGIPQEAPLSYKEQLERSLYPPENDLLEQQGIISGLRRGSSPAQLSHGAFQTAEQSAMDEAAFWEQEEAEAQAQAQAEQERKEEQANRYVTSPIGRTGLREQLYQESVQSTPEARARQGRQDWMNLEDEIDAYPAPEIRGLSRAPQRPELTPSQAHLLMSQRQGDVTPTAMETPGVQYSPTAEPLGRPEPVPAQRTGKKNPPPVEIPEGVQVASSGYPYKKRGAENAVKRLAKKGIEAEVVPLGGEFYGVQEVESQGPTAQESLEETVKRLGSVEEVGKVYGGNLEVDHRARQIAEEMFPTVPAKEPAGAESQDTPKPEPKSDIPTDLTEDPVKAGPLAELGVEPPVSDHISQPGKMVGEEAENNKDRLPNADQQAFIENKVKELGSLEAVEKHYPTDTTVDKMARAFARGYYEESGTTSAPKASEAIEAGQGPRGESAEQTSLSELITDNGAPFQTKGEATLAIRKAKALGTHDAVEVDGGWVGQEREVPVIEESDYDRKREARADRYRERAKKADGESAAAYKRSDDLSSAFYMGQPILVGHHSEKRARKTQERMHNAMSKSIEAGEKAGYYREKALAAENNTAISSDDSNAIVKLREKLRGAEQHQEVMKAINKIAKAKKLTDDEKVSKIVESTGFKEEDARSIVEPDFAGRIGFPSYQLQNNNANIRRMKERLKQLEARQDDETTEIEHDGITITDNVEENRVQIEFPGKPGPETITTLKHNGFKWSRGGGVWQRHRSDYALHLAKQIVGAKDTEAAVKPPEQGDAYLEYGIPETDAGITSHTGVEQLLESLESGQATPEQVKGAFADLRANKAQIIAGLKKLPKDSKKKGAETLLRKLGPMGRARYKNEPKADVVQAVYHELVTSFNLSDTLSYSHGQNIEDVVQKKVDGYTQADLDAFAEKIKERRAEASKRFDDLKKSIENPETLEDFKKFIHYRGKDALTPEQAATYDALAADAIQEKRATEKEKAATLQGVKTDTALKIVEGVHTKKGHPIFTVTMGDRVGREVFTDMKAKAKALGGYYSRYRGQGAVPGFIFEDRGAAEKFVSLKEGDVSVVEETTARDTKKQEKAVTKLMELAEKAEAKAKESLSQDRKTGTARQARMAASATDSANKEIAFAKTLRNVATGIQDGTVKYLSGLRNKSQLATLRRSLMDARNKTAAKEQDNRKSEEIYKREPVESDVSNATFPRVSLWGDHMRNLAFKLDEIQGGKTLARQIRSRVPKSDVRYTFKGVDDYVLLKKINDKFDDKFELWSIPETLQDRARLKRMGIITDEQTRAALRELVGLTEAKAKEDPIKAKERELIGQKPGVDFFPTPAKLAREIVEKAEIEPGMRVLEPSAGKGDIAEAIREAQPEAALDTVELSTTLQELLKLKGFDVVGHDFMEHSGEYDRIVMNPPFSKGMDVDHVRHAYDQLKPGGRIVVIMSEHPFFAKDKKSTDFMEWLADKGTAEELPAGSFNGGDAFRKTGVNSRVVVIDKGMAAEQGPGDASRAKLKAAESRMAEARDKGRRLRKKYETDRDNAALREEVKAADREFNQAAKDMRAARTELREETGALYSTGEAKAAPVTREDLEALPMVQKVTGKDGTYTIHFKNGVRVPLKTVEAVGKDAYLINPKGEKLFKRGWYDGKGITITQYGDKHTASHEMFHFAEDVGLIDARDKAILNRAARKAEGKLKTADLAEARARYVEQAMRDREAHRGTKIGEILQKLADFFDRIVNVFKRTARGSVRDFEKGSFKGEGIQSVHDLAPQYSGQKITETSEFKKWFGDSKVVDENGEPLVVYHGTNLGFEEFQPEIGRYKGSYFSSDPSYAERYGSNVMPVYAAVENPFVVDLDKDGTSGAVVIDRKIIGFYRDLSGDAVETLKKQGYDGITAKYEGNNTFEVVTFESTQAKSTFNTGTFNPKDPRIMYSLALEDVAGAVQSRLNKGYFKGWLDDLTSPSVTGDIAPLSRAVSLISSYARKIPALKRVYDIAEYKQTAKHEIEHDITHTEDGVDMMKHLKDFRKKSRAAYKKLSEYFDHRDVNQIGYSVKQDPDNPSIWILHNTKGKPTAHTSINPEELWDKARKLEAEAYRLATGDRDAAQALYYSRKLNDAEFSEKYKTLMEYVEVLEANGMPTEIAYTDEQGVPAVDLKLALKLMGDRRGYYMPRIWQEGDFNVFARKDGDEFNILEKFDRQLLAKRRKRELEAQGYTVKIVPSEKPSEELFNALASTSAQEALTNKLLSKMGRTNKVLTLEDLSLHGRWEGDTYVIEGSLDREYEPLFKKHGGVKKERTFKPGRHGWWLEWRFDGKDKKAFPEQIKTEIFALKGTDTNTPLALAKEFVQEYANVHKARGARQSLIQRSGAKGFDVYKGYEEDLNIRLAKSVRRYSAGKAKQDMALGMLEAINGRDVSWDEFKEVKQFEGGFGKWEATGSKIDRETFDEIRNHWVKDPQYIDYQEFVHGRMIDPSKQRHAYTDAMEFFKHMLRNDEAMDRAVGFLKGLAVLKYLGFRPAAAAVNVTNMVAAVPAVINAETSASLPKTLKLVRDGITRYVKYKTGKEVSAEDRKIFEYITRKGWDQAQLNSEALGAIQSRTSRAWSGIIDTSMKMFGWTEAMNRGATIYAAFKAQSEGTFKERMDKAHEMGNDAHGVYSKANKPAVMRGGGIGANMLQMAYVFRTFTHNYMVTMLRLGFKEKQAKAACWMAFAPVIFGAGSALGVKTVIQAIGKAMGSDDPEEDFYRMVASNFGAVPAKLVRFGLPGMVNMDMTGSLRIGIADLPTDMKGFIGAPGDVVVSLYKGLGEMGRGNVQKGFERIMPNAIGNISKGIREYSEGVTTRSNSPVFYHDEPLKASEIDALLRVFSFNPASLSQKKSELWSDRKRKFRYQDARGEIYDRIRRFHLSRKKSDWVEIVALTQRYNEDAPEGEKQIDLKKEAKRIAKKMRR